MGCGAGAFAGSGVTVRCASTGEAVAAGAGVALGDAGVDAGGCVVAADGGVALGGNGVWDARRARTAGGGVAEPCHCSAGGGMVAVGATGVSVGTAVSVGIGVTSGVRTGVSVACGVRTNVCAVAAGAAWLSSSSSSLSRRLLRSLDEPPDCEGVLAGATVAGGGRGVWNTSGGGVDVASAAVVGTIAKGAAVGGGKGVLVDAGAGVSVGSGAGVSVASGAGVSAASGVGARVASGAGVSVARLRDWTTGVGSRGGGGSTANPPTAVAVLTTAPVTTSRVVVIELLSPNGII